jgi:hypothetical protein
MTQMRHVQQKQTLRERRPFGGGTPRRTVVVVCDAPRRHYLPYPGLRAAEQEDYCQSRREDPECIVND